MTRGSGSTKCLFPASAELFLFCRGVAEERTPDGRVMDLDVGRLVGFENARTSRWKYGRIAVEDAMKLAKLSDGLDVDLSLLVKIAAGQMSADEALDIHRNPSAFLEFLAEGVRLPKDGMGLDLIASPGGHARLKRQGSRRYQRHAAADRPDGRPSVIRRAAALLIDDDETAAKVFRNVASLSQGLKVEVADTAVAGLIAAGRMQPDLIVLDLFMPGIDGFAALRALKRGASARPAYLAASVSTPTSDLVYRALGAGADEVVSRPLDQRQIGRLFSKMA